MLDTMWRTAARTVGAANKPFEHVRGPAGAAVAAATYKQLGAEAYRRGEYAAAARHFADAADAREDAPAPLHANRSAALLRAGNAGGALEAAGEAVRRPRANRRWGGARRRLASRRIAHRAPR